jgi:hypothetical protein
MVFSYRGLADGTSQTVISQIVPPAKNWKIRKLDICSRCYGEFYIVVNGAIIGDGKTSPIETNVSFIFAPYQKVDENLTVEVFFKKNYGPILDVSAYLHLTES